MNNSTNNSKELENKLKTVKYKCDNESHLAVNQELCKNCKDKICTHICPAGVYSFDDKASQMIIQYENCLECGACKIVCKSIKWCYPKSGHGVIFKNS